MLEQVDIMVIDLQDIGSRSYTYISAMKYTMQACFKKKIPVVVLDRPNPLGGLKVEGPILQKKYQSYVGTFRIPYVHGLTIGELAKMAVDDIPEKGTIYVVRMSGWHRNMVWQDTGLKWHATSGAVPTVESVYGYACTGLGAQLGAFHHGIGTPYPFSFLTHPRLSPLELRQRLEKERLRGFSYDILRIPQRPGKACQEGVHVTVTDWSQAEPMALNLLMLQIDLENWGPEGLQLCNQIEPNLVQ